MQSGVQSGPGHDTPHPMLSDRLGERPGAASVLEYPGPGVVQTDRQDDRQEEHLDARHPDRLEVDENRDVLEERLGEPDRKGVPVDGETRTEGDHECSTRAGDREPDHPELPPPHGQCHQADEQRNA